jgi:hypothetical protein
MKQENSILKVIGIGLAIYGVYKLFESQNQSKAIEPKPSSEEEYVSSLISELSGIKNKNRETKDKIDLLKIKLEQIKKQKQ